MRKISCLLFIISFLLSCNKLSDFFPNPKPPATPQFSKVYGGSDFDAAQSITRSLEGGYVIAGSTDSKDGDVSGNHGGDAWVVKIDKNGNKLWQNPLGGSNGDMAFSIITANDGNYVMAGSTNSNDGDVKGKHQGNNVFGETADAWVVKLDKNGKIQWQKALGGSNDDEAKSITATLDGGYVIAGRTSSNDGDVKGNHGEGDAWVVKLDNDGNIQWQKTYGGSAFDGASSIIANPDGSYVLAGTTLSNDGDVSGNHGDVDAWVVKLDKDGNKLWQKALGGSGDEIAYSATMSLDGGYVIAGQTEISNDGDVSGRHGRKGDAWVVKLDENGNLVWQNPLGGSSGDVAFSIITANDGNYVMAGVTNSSNGDVSGYHGGQDAWVVKLDKRGKIMWQKPLGGSDPDRAQSITQTPYGVYVMAGYTFSNNGNVSGNHGVWDAWVMTIKDQ